MRQSIISIIITCIVTIGGITIGSKPNGDTEQIATTMIIVENTTNENITDEMITTMRDENQTSEEIISTEIHTTSGGAGAETPKPEEPITTTVEETTKTEFPTETETTSRKPVISIPETTTKSQNTGYSSYAAQVAELVNQERAKQGLKALHVDEKVQSAASVRAKEIEQLFSHTRPSGKNFSSVLTENGIRFTGSGENIAWGQRTPQEVMKGWMNSSGHRANILNAKYTKIGVGYYVGANGRQYWTQLFIY